MERSISDLRQRQSLPLGAKVNMTQRRILEWVREFGENGVYVSFSGGKDSTVLLHLVRQMFPNIDAVFVDTGLEYPEIKKFVKQHENVTILRPKMGFKDVICKYGYPVISKEASQRVYNARLCIKSNGETYIEHYYQVTGKYPNQRIEQLYAGRFGKRYDFSKWEPLVRADFAVSDKCCMVMKKKPIKQNMKGKAGITAQMAAESQLRQHQWILHGCNGFDMKRPTSNPMSFWTEQDVLQYIKENDIEICSVYGDIIPEGGQMVFDGMPCKLCTTGCDRTGCVFCGYGAHLEKGEGRFQRLKRTHPKLYDYCIGGGAYDPEDGLWKPDKNGLGMAHVFDELCKLYGSDFIKYK